MHQVRRRATPAVSFIPANAEACLNKVNATYGKLKQGRSR
jgi:hypothetical protein